MPDISIITKFLTAALLFSLIGGCSRDGFLVTESGLHYTIHESFGKPKPQTGEIMYMHLVYKNNRDSVLFDSKTIGDEFSIELVKPLFKGGLEEAFQMLGEGDSASFIVNADSLYEKVFHAKRPSYINKGEKLRFEVRMNRIVPAEDYRSAKKKKNMRTAADEDLEIREYLAENNILVKPLKSGLVYISFVEGKGRRPGTGDSVVVSYTGMFLNGEIFDQTDKSSGALTFKTGDGSMIPAWEEGISLMKEGGKARLIIPSRLAYGENGYGPVDPNTTIVYDVVLERIK